MTRIRYAAGLALGGLLASLLPARTEEYSFAEVSRGRYLATAGDCIACHTREGGPAFGGGAAIPTPFGTIYGPNITPDPATGIGNWSEDDFFRAMHEGIDERGNHLYPAMPYPNYTKVTRDDVRAIWAYLRTLPPVSYKRPPNRLAWPLNVRGVMIAWNDLFFDEGFYRPNPQKSDAWNRGAYLVEGLGHCGACHTPTNVFGAADTGSRLQGGDVQSWFAPSLLGGDLKAGLGRWSEAEIVDFLKTGRNARTAAYGPMAEVVTNSTSKLTDEDLKAIAVYLKDLPAPQRHEQPKQPDQNAMQAGEAIYIDACAACHQANGQGIANTFPALQGAAIVQADDPTTVIRLILDGSPMATTGARPSPFAMPAFRWKLSDAQVAAVATYVRNAWGNAAKSVSEGDVKAVRGAGHAGGQ